MIRPLAIFCTVLVPMLGSTEGWSADFQTGLNAYKIGNYATALREFRPLGEQGDLLDGHSEAKGPVAAASEHLRHHQE